MKTNITDAQINEITKDTIGNWPSFEAQSWACKVVHAVLNKTACLNERLVTGALFDFLGFLTTSETKRTFSSHDEATVAVEAITEFAKLRGLDLSEADVQNWRTKLNATALPTASADEIEASFEAHRIAQTKIPGMPGLAARPSFVAGFQAGRASTSADALKKQNAEVVNRITKAAAELAKEINGINDDAQHERLMRHMRSIAQAVTKLNFTPAHHGVQAISAQSTQTDEVAELSDLQTYSLDADGNLFACGFEPGEYVRLDDVRSLLSSRKGKDAERLDRLEMLVKESGYAVQLQQVRHPDVNAGVNRIALTVCVGSGPWAKTIEGNSVRAAIDSAIEHEKDGAK